MYRRTGHDTKLEYVAQLRRRAVTKTNRCVGKYCRSMSMRISTVFSLVVGFQPTCAVHGANLASRGVRALVSYGSNGISLPSYIVDLTELRNRS